MVFKEHASPKQKRTYPGLGDEVHIYYLRFFNQIIGKRRVKNILNKLEVEFIMVIAH